MNVFGDGLSMWGRARAQFATLFVEKHARKDNRLLCIWRYGFVIKTGFKRLNQNYNLALCCTVNFYLASVYSVRSEAETPDSPLSWRPSSSHNLSYIDAIKSLTIRAGDCGKDSVMTAPPEIHRGDFSKTEYYRRAQITSHAAYHRGSLIGST